jgi:hypothetical protein
MQIAVFDFASEMTQVFSLSLISWCWKKNKRRLMRSPCCLCLWIPPPQSTSEWPNRSYETWYIYHSTWAHLSGVLNEFLSSVSVFLCMCIYIYINTHTHTHTHTHTPLIVDGQLLDKHVPGATNTRNDRRIFFVCLNPLLFASCTDTAKLLEAWRGVLSSTPPYK